MIKNTKQYIKQIKIKPCNCVVFGNQLETDIIPVKKIGIKTVYIGNKKQGFFIYCPSS